MPTPFQHLVYAKSILESPRLPAALHERLCQDAGAFFLGNTAADVQSLTGQPRVETHFYRLSTLGDARAHHVMMNTYPGLADPYRLAPARAAFISGYLAHLVWDEVWAAVVFLPFYYESPLWKDRLTRSIHHNAFRVLLDRQAEAELRAEASLIPLLQRLSPEGWLPFAQDHALCKWRDWLVAQLISPENVETAQVFAQRMDISVAQLEETIRAVELGIYQPPLPGLEAALVDFEARARAESLSALLHYWHINEDLNISWDAGSPKCERSRDCVLLGSYAG